MPRIARLIITLQLVAIALVTCVAIVAEHAKGASSAHVVAKVWGCPQEDSCRIDYRASGAWVITRAPH